jgi:hypothetical protein
MVLIRLGKLHLAILALTVGGLSGAVSQKPSPAVTLASSSEATQAKINRALSAARLLSRWEPRSQR